MAIKQLTDAIRSSLLALILPMAGCHDPSPKGIIPDPDQTRSVSIILYDDAGKITSQCVVKDGRTIREIYDCLTPYEHSKDAADIMGSGPVIGRLEFQSPRGMTRVEFVDPGKNPLCFRVGDSAYLRGGAKYRGYRSDHKRLYGIDSEGIDEGLAFYRKLEDFCTQPGQTKGEQKRGERKVGHSR